MDNLTRDMMLAKQAGMSYGKWKAMQPVVAVIPEGWATCEYCGGPFKPIKKKRFCDSTCRDKAYEGKRRELWKDWYMRKHKEGGRSEDKAGGSE